MVYWTLIAIFLNKVQSHKILCLAVVISFAIGMGFGFVNISTEFSLQRSAAMLPFFVLGFAMKRHAFDWLAPYFETLVRPVGISCFILGWIYLIGRNFTTYMTVDEITLCGTYYTNDGELIWWLLTRVANYLTMVPACIWACNHTTNKHIPVVTNWGTNLTPIFVLNPFLSFIMKHFIYSGIITKSTLWLGIVLAAVFTVISLFVFSSKPVVKFVNYINSLGGLLIKRKDKNAVHS